MTTANSKPWQIIVNEHRLRVTYRDTDQMGFVYYANYLVWFEAGRTELLRQTGHSYREFEEMGYVLPVVRCVCEYKKPARYDDIICIRTHIRELSRVGVTFYYQVLRDAEGELLAEGETKHVIVSREGKIVRAGDILEAWLRPVQNHARWEGDNCK